MIARRHNRIALLLLTGAIIVLYATPALALAHQGRGGAPPGPPPGGGQGAPGGGMGGPMPGGGIGPMGGVPGRNVPLDRPTPGGQGAGARRGLQLGPPGRWWDDKSYARTLRLRPEQQARMDAIFEQSRPALTARYDDLRQAETQMDQLSKAPKLDEAALFAQIDKVKQCRAELDKTYTHMLLQIRNEMDPAQIARLDQR